MLDPFSLLPLSLAARGGYVDDFEVQQLVAAGLTLLQRSAALVRALGGKRSGILLPTSPQFFIALAASEGRGAVLINPLASRFEIAHQISDAGIGAVFTTNALSPMLPSDLPRVLLDDAPRTATVITGGIPRDVDLGSHIGLTLEGDPDTHGSREEAAIVYTSAMQGVPLGAILTHRNLLANARSTMEVVGNSKDDRVLALLPFSHLFGLTVTASAPLLAGASVVTMPRFEPSRAVELLIKCEVNQVVGVPSVFRALLIAIEKHGATTRSDFANVRMCICGGAPLALELQEQWFDVTGVELRQGYGLTEAGPVCLFNRADRPNVRGALGYPLPGVEVNLIDGEIAVRGDNVFSGYVSNGADGLHVTDGWLLTGDGGAMNADRSVAFTDVIKPMFTRNGFNIYPTEIVQAVLALEGVRRATVTEGRRDAGREADVVLEYAGLPDEQTVRDWCKERIATYKQPTVIKKIE
ncbi:MAG TPA: AMP-binding protein [Gemmatimonadaceae bacterium]